MHTKLFDINPVTGTRKMWHYDAEKDEATIETIIDASQIVSDNKERFNSFDEKANWKGDMHHVASIPMALFYQMKAEGKLDDEAYMKRWLNDPDNRAFRTRPGEV
jgi:hypothetical protein